MNATAAQTADWYAKMLMPLENSVKINIINKLSASMLKDTESNKKNLSFFDGLNNSWCDNVSPEEEAASIRNARMSGKTRVLEEF